MNDPITILTAALLHAQGRFDFYARNHEAKADKLKLQLTETPEGLDPEAATYAQGLIDDTLAKAKANRDEFARITSAIYDAVNLIPSQVRVVPLDLLGAAMACVTKIAPGGEVRRRLREIAFDGDAHALVTLEMRGEAVRSPDAIPGTALARAYDLPMNFVGRESLNLQPDHMTQLRAFHDLYGVPQFAGRSTDDRFQHMTNERVAMRLDLIAEEVIELFEDGFGIAIEMTLLSDTGADVNTQAIAEVLDRTEMRNGTEVADALGDIVYLCYGMALELGYDLRAVVREIHASNLTKLGADGVPIMREDGKVLKGPNYMPPNIAAVLGFVEAS